jgi:phosphate-selective porin OprO/OprP
MARKSAMSGKSAVAGKSAMRIKRSMMVAGLLLTAPAMGQPTGGERNFSLGAADGAWHLSLHGLVQVDGRVFSGDSDARGADELRLRRVRPIFEGSSGRLAFRFMPDFGNGDSQIVDAYVDTKLAAHLSFRAGKFKAPVGLERLQSASDLLLVERSAPTELVPNRDIGLQIAGGDRVTWAAGLFDGVADGRSGDGDDDGRPEIAARVFALPTSEKEGPNDTVLGVGLALTYGSRRGSAATPLLEGYRSPGQQTIFRYRRAEAAGADGPGAEGTYVEGTFADGERLRIVPQLYAYRGPFGVSSEWVRVREHVSRAVGGVERSATLEHEAWQITGEWFVTGERASYKGAGTPHAVQLVARLAQLSPDAEAFAAGPASFADPAVSAARARTVALGVNWFPLSGIKASAAWQHTTFESDAPIARPAENVLLLRWQLAF